MRRKRAGTGIEYPDAKHKILNAQLTSIMALIRFQTAPLNGLMNNFWNLPADGSVTTQPVVNIVETPNGYRLELAAPGFGKGDFQVNVEQNLLHISGAKEVARTEDGTKFHRREFSYGSFERVFRLPENIDADKVEAVFNNGILLVHLVKKAELQPVVKTIAVG